MSEQKVMIIPVDYHNKLRIGHMVVKQSAHIEISSISQFELIGKEENPG